MTNEEPKNLYLLPNGLISYCRTSNEDVEYTCTDTLIDKACEWLEDNAINYVGKDGIMAWRSVFADFRKAMKGVRNGSK